MHAAFLPALPSPGACWSTLRDVVHDVSTTFDGDGAPQYQHLRLSDGPAGAADVFRPDSVHIALDAELVDVPTGSRLTSVWISEGEAIASSDYEICRQDLTVGALTHHARFAPRRPVDGWPTGNYRLELLIDGELSQTVRFRVQP